MNFFHTVDDVSVNDCPIRTMNEMKLVFGSRKDMLSIVRTNLHILIHVALSNNANISQHNITILSIHFTINSGFTHT